MVSYNAGSRNLSIDSFDMSVVQSTLVLLILSLHVDVANLINTVIVVPHVVACFGVKCVFPQITSPKKRP